MRTFTLLTVGLLTAGAVPARAALTPTLVDVVSTPDGYLWTYLATIPEGDWMQGYGSVPGAGTLPRDTNIHPEEPTCPCPQIRDYLTIYDFNGFLDVVQFSDSGLEWTSYPFGSTPADAVVDENAVANVTIFQAGASILYPGERFSFALLSSIGGSPQVVSYAAELTNPQTQLGHTSFGLTQGPAQATQVPEPRTWVLLASGLLAMACFARHQRSARS